MVSDAYPRPFEGGERQAPAARERGGLLAMDPLLLLAALGLIGFSLFTLGAATGHDVPNSPYFYVVRQAIYAVIGVALMLAIARVDYSRFSELRVGLYTAMIDNHHRGALSAQATRGSRRWIELPFFTFQPSELGKVLLILALAGFAIDRGRRVGERQRTARILLLGFVPALIVIMQPDLGTGIVYIVITPGDAVRRRGAMDALRAPGRAAGGRGDRGAGDRSGDRAPGPARATSRSG